MQKKKKGSKTYHHNQLVCDTICTLIHDLKFKPCSNNGNMSYSLFIHGKA